MINCLSPCKCHKQCYNAKAPGLDFSQIDSRVCEKQVQALLIIALGAASNLALTLHNVKKY